MIASLAVFRLVTVPRPYYLYGPPRSLLIPQPEFLSFVIHPSIHHSCYSKSVDMQSVGSIVTALLSLRVLTLIIGSKGRWTEAEELEVQGVETNVRVLGQDHPDALTSMANLASTYRNQGRWKEAEELDVQVMETRERVLGAEHPSTLTSMNNLAFTLKSQSRSGKAISLMKKCFQLQKQILGSQHPHTKTSLEALNEWQKENLAIGL